MTAPTVISFGCRLNLAESEAIRATLADAGDLVVVNSCAVTAEAARDARRAVRRIARERPGARIVVTGCASEIDPRFAAMPEVERVVANAAKLDAARYGLSPRADPLPATTHARAFLPIQNGCDQRCTFCIIPYGRGPSRSEPAGALVNRARALVAAGHQEIVLTGVDITAYGVDLPGRPTLALLVERLLRLVPELPRLRLTSLDPALVDNRLIELLTGEPRLMPHIHLSLQAGDDLILKRMKRRHLRADAVRLVERLKAKRDIAIGADLIAGFPTEDDAAAANNLALIDDCEIVFGHIFPYSSRPGTPAARMPQVPRDAIKARAAALRAASARRRHAWLDGLIGTTQSVLIENDGESGHADNFAPVSCPREGGDPAAFAQQKRGPRLRGDKANIIIPLTITARHGDTLLGTPA